MTFRVKEGIEIAGSTFADGVKNTYARTLTANAGVSSTTTSTGTVIVTGGVGISENLNVGGNTVITGNLTVNGTTTTVNTSEMTVDDINITLGDIASPTNTTADGGGITLRGTTNKTFNWVNLNSAWTSSENLDLASGKTYKINAVDVLSSTTLGTNVVNSSLTSVGTITSGTWNGGVIAGQYGGTGVANTGKTITLGGNFTTSGAYALSFTLSGATSLTLPTSGTVATTGNLSQFASTTSAQLAGVISDETGSGLVVFNNSPTLITPTLGAASATTINKVTITAPANSATLTVADGKTLTASNTLTFTGTDGSSVAFGAGGTVVYTSNKLSVFAATTSAELAGVISDETGTGLLVFNNTPTLTTPTIAVINGATTASGTLTLRSTSNATKATAGVLMDEAIASTSTATGTLVITGGLGVSGRINAANFDGIIGANTAAAGSFTTISASGNVTANGSNATISLAPTGTGTVTINPATTGTINNTSIGATTRSTGAFTSLAANAAVTFTQNTGSTSTTSGTLVVTGGTGISENLYVGGNTVITGDLTVNGTTTTVNSTTVSVDDKNIELGSIASPTDTTADGGGITLKGSTDKTFNWVNATGAWTSSENLNLATGKAYYINGTSVLNATTLGSGVTSSSLTSVGTIGTGTWQGSVISSTYGGTGVNNGGRTLTINTGNLTFTANAAGSSVTVPQSGTLATTGNLSQFAATTSAQLAGVISDETGSGALVFATSPTLVTPTLGAATATTINKLTITAPATSATLTIADGKTLTVSNTLTFTGTDSSSVAFGTGGTVVYTSNKLSVHAATTSAELAGVISDETGSGLLVFNNSPTFITPTLGAATATTINKVTITAPTSGSTLTIADGKTLTVSNTLTFTGTDSSSVAFGTGGTVVYTSNNLGSFAATTSAQLAGVISDETGTGLLVFNNTPTLTTPTIAVINGATTASGTHTIRGTSNATKATASVLMDDNVASTSTSTGTLVVTGGVGISGAVYAGSVQNTPIGSTTASTGAFTTLTASGNTTLSGSNATIAISPTGTGTVTINPATAGTINNMSIGATTRSTGAFTTLAANNAVTLTLGTDASSTTVGGTLTVTGGTAISAKLYVGGDTAITSNTTASSTTSGALQVTGGVGIQGALYAGSIQNTPIGSTTASTGAFTTLSASSSVTFNAGIASTNTTNGTLVITGGVGISGALNAATKSFSIPHPTKPGMTLRYGSLEGPEFGVYVRGRVDGKAPVIELPEYWTKLVDETTITVDITPIGKHQKLYVDKIEDNKIYIGTDNMFTKTISCFYTIWGARKDVDKLIVEDQA